ncbi:type I glyceraldehyde-3-phosphate dehydrogenase [Candidatus Peregrinibacteria bacterium]|nr:type I glyceraldehyde-3-phosphate dehydrogenase [Candidatus Peregrinibacteria bacterium]
MNKPRIAINGFGRIGRMMLRCNLVRDLVDIVAINDLSPSNVAAHLLKHDSTYGSIKDDIKAEGNSLIINDKKIQLFATREPLELPWGDTGIDVVLEATGVFTDREGAGKHIKAGARRVIVTAPAKNPDATFVRGVNCGSFDPKKHFIVSNASCTTNCLAPMAKVLDETFEIQRGFMTTVHAYTSDQNLLDNAHKDLRRARAAGLSLIPTSTGAAKAIGEVLPHLAGKLNGVAVRAPTPTVSLVDLTCDMGKAPKDAAEVNNTLRKAASAGSLKGILHVEDEPLVSVDFKHNEYSSIVDSALTMVIGNMVKTFAWYDNEWGYSMRTIELAAMIGAA